MSKARQKWNADDDSLLLTLVERHQPLKDIAKILDRPVGGVHSRLNNHHSKAWHASGHPSCQPKKGKPGATQQQQQIDDLTERMVALERTVDRLTRDLGVSDGK